MLKLRLKKVGKRYFPSYKLVVINSKQKQNGKQINIVGYYNPFLKTYKFNVNNIYKYFYNGIKPNKKVFYLLKKLNYTQDNFI
uniref:Ribosomal protein S16 n=1 Tax=Nitzschia sp. PL3-2 TaxID=2083271 RepID=A0A2Z5ZA26_9STRA|nr:ribosomal protein S16 [Nitzschia sp. PL3-2]